MQAWMKLLGPICLAVVPEGSSLVHGLTQPAMGLVAHPIQLTPQLDLGLVLTVIQPMAHALLRRRPFGHTKFAPFVRRRGFNQSGNIFTHLAIAYKMNSSFVGKSFWKEINIL